MGGGFGIHPRGGFSTARMRLDLSTDKGITHSKLSSSTAAEKRPIQFKKTGYPNSLAKRWKEGSGQNINALSFSKAMVHQNHERIHEPDFSSRRSSCRPLSDHVGFICSYRIHMSESRCYPKGGWQPQPPICFASHNVFHVVVTQSPAVATHETDQP